MKVGIRASELCLLHQSLACCVTPGKSSGAGLAPIDVNGSRVRLLGLLGLAGNSNPWLGKRFKDFGQMMLTKHKVLFYYLFIYLFEWLLK